MSLLFGNIFFTGLRKEDILKKVEFSHVITVNAEILVEANKNKKLLAILNSNITTIDGQLPYLFIKKRNPGMVVEKISGSDFIYDVAQYCSECGKSLFLLGGSKSSNIESIKKLEEKYKIRISGYSPPYSEYPFPEEHNNEIINQIRQFIPDYLFVGFGAVKQEFWIDDNRCFLEQLGVKMAVGSGGTFDFVSGNKKRAPLVVQKLCLEGVYRLIVEFRLFRVKRLMKSFKMFRYI